MKHDRKKQIHAAILSAAKHQFQQQQQKLHLQQRNDPGNSSLISSTPQSSQSSQSPLAAAKLVAPISPSPTDLISHVLSQLTTLSKVNVDNDGNGSLMIDFGVGDGRWVIAAYHRFQCQCIGYDIDPERIQLSQSNVQQYETQHNIQLHDKIQIYQQDVFCVLEDSSYFDVINADVLVFYLFREALIRIKPLLQKRGFQPNNPSPNVCKEDENKMDGCQKHKKVEIISVGFALPGWSSPTWNEKCCGLNVYIYESYIAQEII